MKKITKPKELHFLPARSTIQNIYGLWEKDMSGWWVGDYGMEQPANLVPCYLIEED